MGSGTGDWRTWARRWGEEGWCTVRFRVNRERGRSVIEKTLLLLKVSTNVRNIGSVWDCVVVPNLTTSGDVTGEM